MKKNPAKTNIHVQSLTYSKKEADAQTAASLTLQRRQKKKRPRSTHSTGNLCVCVEYTANREIWCNLKFNLKPCKLSDTNPFDKNNARTEPSGGEGTQRGDRKYPLSRRGCCCVWGSLGVKWKRQWVEPQRGKEERKEWEKSERAAQGERQEGRGERKKGGKEGRKRERDRWKLETHALDCPLSVSGPLNGLLKSKLWNNSTLYSSANTWVDSL